MMNLKCLVSIKLHGDLSIPIWCDWKLFFHKRSRGLPTFQFLYGAIERNPAHLQCRANRCFNSYMVRLEVAALIVGGGKVKRFNSYMVRLEAI